MPKYIINTKTLLLRLAYLAAATYVAFHIWIGFLGSDMGIAYITIHQGAPESATRIYAPVQGIIRKNHGESEDVLPIHFDASTGRSTFPLVQEHGACEYALTILAEDINANLKTVWISEDMNAIFHLYNTDIRYRRHDIYFNLYVIEDAGIVAYDILLDNWSHLYQKRWHGEVPLNGKIEIFLDA